MYRRQFLGAIGAVGFASVLPRPVVSANPLLTRTIPSSGARIPAVGMGTWITFDVGNDSAARDQRTEVLRRFFEQGGGVIDSSPMYGSSQAVVGHGLAELGYPEGLFAADKVWMYGREPGQQQMTESEQLWGLEDSGFELMQVHNLMDWQSHLKTLRQWQDDGRIRYIGITTSHGRRHDELEQIMRSEPLDFVQFTYNVVDREAENRLLPLAADRGIAVVINRPFRRGGLFHPLNGQPLPGWAVEQGINNWGQFFLTFILSHPAVTVAIPATSKVEHMSQNMAALHGPLPDEATRRRMVEAYRALS